jgi:hypothetical protein
MAKSKTKRRVSLAASIGKKLLGSSKTTVEEEQSEPSEAGSPTTEAPACALSMELRGHASVNVQKLTAMQVQLQVRCSTPNTTLQTGWRELPPTRRSAA